MNLSKNINLIIKGCSCAAIILFTTLSYSQDRTQNLGDFSILKVFNGLSLELVRSNEQKVVITGEETDNVTIKNTNGRLKVYLRFPESFEAEKVKIKLYHKDDINILDVNEGSAIFSDEVIKQQNLSIRSQEGAYLHLELDVKYLTVKVVSGGAIKLRGKAINQEVEVNTGGIYEAFGLITEYADINAASGAKAEVNVSNLLDAKVSLGGNIYYQGNPEKINTKKVLGGKIRNKG